MKINDIEKSLISKRKLIAITVIEIAAIALLIFLADKPKIDPKEEPQKYEYERVIAKEVVIEEPEETEVIYESEYDRIVALIQEAAEIEGINPKMAVAIARLETGNFTSDLFVNGHNFGGLLGKNGYYTYNSEPDGLVAYMKCLKWYKDSGMDTVDKMANTYCPNGNWADRVKKIMKEL